MLKFRYILFAMVLLAFAEASAQKSYREHLRSGNKIYADSVYDDAEVEYRKAIELNSGDAYAHYNLGNALLFQNKGEDAVKEYERAAQNEKDKQRLAQIYHNAGVVMQSAKDYANAVKMYKEALRNNPNDNETRYNLTLAMNQLKNQQEQQQQEQEQQEQQQEQQQQEQQQEQQEQQQEQQQQEMSRENAEQLLESAMQDEKDVQEKVKKLIQLKGRKLEKDW